MNINTTLPELLAPCGSPEALYAAISAGADAVYFGGDAFNARMNAKNFASDALREAIDLCRLHRVKTNITLNTLIHTREMNVVLRSVEQLYTLGCDALIVADLGVARQIHHHFPDLELHASTQASGHNVDAAKEFAALGFSRMVAARELSFGNLLTLCQSSPIETEIFIHGAVCVSQSGQCLASSLIGGRSGNRGECAQPCRLPYQKSGASSQKSTYALSLKDICLASHITEILSLGAASLKIEGRMKSPDYVYGVTRIYRRLLDEGINATPDELAELSALFSRSGFTDGYFTGKTDKKMLGIRTDADKAESAASAGKANYTALLQNRRQPLSLALTLEAGKPSLLTASDGTRCVTVLGAIPEPAKSCPLTVEAVKKNLTKLGNTPFFAETADVTLLGSVMMPISELNALRRRAVEQLCQALVSRRKTLPKQPLPPLPRIDKPLFTARFHDYAQIPEDTSLYDIVYLPLEKFSADMMDRVSGVILPPVIFDAEMPEICAMLKRASEAGIRHALLSNLGHIRAAKEAHLTLHGDFRLNVYNPWTVDALHELGFADILASPELTLPKLRDLGLAPVLYGRIPLMTLEKCVIRDLYDCQSCQRRQFLPLRDRKGVDFPLTRSWKHRNILYNSVPLWMADRQEELHQYCIHGGHLIFTDESAARAKEIGDAYQGKASAAPPKNGIRRISK